jgi:hypothetical protein
MDDTDISRSENELGDHPGQTPGTYTAASSAHPRRQSLARTRGQDPTVLGVIASRTLGEKVGELMSRTSPTRRSGPTRQVAGGRPRALQPSTSERGQRGIKLCVHEMLTEATGPSDRSSMGRSLLSDVVDGEGGARPRGRVRAELIRSCPANTHLTFPTSTDHEHHTGKQLPSNYP